MRAGPGGQLSWLVVTIAHGSCRTTSHRATFSRCRNPSVAKYNKLKSVPLYPTCTSTAAATDFASHRTIVSTTPTITSTSNGAHSRPNCEAWISAKNKAVSSTATHRFKWRTSTGNSSPRKNNSSSNGANATPRNNIIHADVLVLNICWIGSCFGIGSNRSTPSSETAITTPPITNAGHRKLGHRQWIASENERCLYPATIRYMKNSTMQYANACAGTSTRASLSICCVVE